MKQDLQLLLYKVFHLIKKKEREIGFPSKKKEREIGVFHS